MQRRTVSRKSISLTLVFVVCQLVAAHAQTAPSPSCTFQFGFAEMAALLPEQVGNCVTDQMFDPQGQPQGDRHDDGQAQGHGQERLDADLPAMAPLPRPDRVRRGQQHEQHISPKQPPEKPAAGKHLAQLGPFAPRDPQKQRVVTTLQKGIEGEQEHDKQDDDQDK